MSNQSLLSISGAENDKSGILWSEFTKHINSGTAENPRKGSLGVHFNLNENLANLYANCDYDMARLKAALRTRGLTDDQSKQLCQFLEMTESNTPDTMFFIKKGIYRKWLVKRIGHYRFDPTKRYPHRISYEYVRDVTPEEGLPARGVGIKTVAIITA
jgi:hypothetical protein